MVHAASSPSIAQSISVVCALAAMSARRAVPDVCTGTLRLSTQAPCSFCTAAASPLRLTRYKNCAKAASAREQCAGRQPHQWAGPDLTV
jgi:hypothetical protein